MEVLTTMDLVGLAGVEVLEVITGTGTETEGQLNAYPQNFQFSN